jgi:hypothetical protein
MSNIANGAGLAALLYSAYGMLAGALRHGVGAAAPEEDEVSSFDPCIREG